MPGLIPRAIQELFNLINGMRSTFNVTLSCYMVEIYRNELRDLIPKNTRERQKLEIRKNPEGQVVIKNANVKTFSNMGQCNEIFEQGLTGRQVRKTNMNDESSRSHLIFSIIVESTNKQNG